MKSATVFSFRLANQLSRCYSSVSKIPSDIRIVEVGPRDGLQNETNPVPTSDKVDLIQRLAEAGCCHIEAGSFVSPKWVPSMADSRQVFEGLAQWRRERKGLILSSLVPNLHGLELAKEQNADEIAIFASASEGFSHKNINCSIEESFKRFEAIIAQADGIPVRGYVSCIFACPYDGRTTPKQVADVTERLLQMGCHEVSLGDTIGIGTPADTAVLLEELSPLIPKLAAHFHDTYGQALANILVAIEAGITAVDSSVAGLGGCPYAKGASGNVATEDVVYMLDGLGVDTGINIEKLVDTAEQICSVLQRPSRSKAGSALASKRQQT